MIDTLSQALRLPFELIEHAIFRLAHGALLFPLFKLLFPLLFSFKLKLLCTSHPPHTLTLATTIRKQGTLSSTRAYSREERQNIYNAQSSVGNGPIPLSVPLTCVLRAFCLSSGISGGRKEGEGTGQRKSGPGRKRRVSPPIRVNDLFIAETPQRAVHRRDTA